jgi:MFS family permease
MRQSTLPFYYGWIVLVASAFAELLAQGATSYSAGLFVLPLQAEFHISRANANSAIVILFLGAAFAAPLAGRALDRFPIRVIVPVGALLFGGALAAIALSSSLLVMALLLLVPASVGFMLLGPLNTSTLAARWFWRNRGLAMGIAAVATSGGGLVVVPLLSRAIAQMGWRTALLYEAAIMAGVVIVLALLFMRDTPASVGIDGHAENQGRPASVEGAKPRPRVGEILSRRDFWVPVLAVGIITSACQAIVVTVVPYGVQLGIAPTTAALFISAFAICAAVTKIVAGILADHFDLSRLAAVAVLVMALAHLSLWLAPSYGGLLAGSCMAGVALGCAMPTTASMIARSFGAAAFGATMGWGWTVGLILTIAATRFIGFIYDATHGYAAAFSAFLVLTVAVLVLVVVLPRRAPG